MKITIKNKFITLLKFRNLLGSAIEPLYFVKMIGKGFGDIDVSESYEHFINNLIRLKSLTVAPDSVLSPDEKYDTYEDIKETSCWQKLSISAALFITMTIVLE